MTTEEKGVSDAILKPEVQLTNVVNQLYQITSCQTRTAELRIKYVGQVSLMQQFVRVERNDCLALQRHLIAQMQPYFYATGRLQFGNSSQIYLQLWKI